MKKFYESKGKIKINPNRHHLSPLNSSLIFLINQVRMSFYTLLICSFDLFVCICTNTRCLNYHTFIINFYIC